ncbi:hypothetical protein GALMADRAFT_1069882 [Galerina marginata CBS 339.88]|uniref:Uncharacterized protein n=1 Tax=Galerina marginata (strain CBS 339.88) TaxID=685588 RepID=A0A067SLI6_GALM3|nr:hypothetical protein GALMADRAFT_1069882 [Galerina marginata CBS 339.88]
MMSMDGWMRVSWLMRSMKLGWLGRLFMIGFLGFFIWASSTGPGRLFASFSRCSCDPGWVVVTLHVRRHYICCCLSQGLFLTVHFTPPLHSVGSRLPAQTFFISQSTPAALPYFCASSKKRVGLLHFAVRPSGSNHIIIIKALCSVRLKLRTLSRLNSFSSFACFFW